MYPTFSHFILCESISFICISKFAFQCQKINPKQPKCIPQKSVNITFSSQSVSSLTYLVVKLPKLKLLITNSQ